MRNADERLGRDVEVRVHLEKGFQRGAELRLVCFWAEPKNAAGSVDRWGQGISRHDQDRNLYRTIRKRLGSCAHWLCGRELRHSSGFVPTGSEFPHQPQLGAGGLLRLHSQATPRPPRES